MTGARSRGLARRAVLATPAVGDQCELVVSGAERSSARRLTPLAASATTTVRQGPA
ncbi:hypothetical protein ACFVDQ_04690 [Streptomyces sp. NPDC057684]|uniref:hypothetical protein n=1 Tax=Streptomyces sp. NPDC057684 TaxID=3346211 RepID=UPI0036784AC5